MTSELDVFERRLKKELLTFEEKKAGTHKPIRKPVVDHVEKGFRVTLNVRKRRHSLLDDQFTVDVQTISRLEATIEAEKQARKAGWPVIGCVFSVEKL